ncbi:MAG: hypothetical protein IJL90_03555 [Lachnospiraceae bacterium]|nr:hypothetical protein [Lachnospiraceae bacterium]
METSKTLYEDGEYLLVRSDGDAFLCIGDNSYKLSDHPYEPCLYIRIAHGTWVTLHNSFTVKTICETALSNGTVTTVSGHAYDMPGILRLLRKTIEISQASVDITYVEALCFMDILEEHGAISEETAIDLRTFGMQNPNVMNTLLHSKKAAVTNDARYYIPGPGCAESRRPDAGGERFSRVISNQVRFGCGYRTVSGQRQYFAWHGYPNRNDDYITYAEICEAEYEQIQKECPREIIADRDTAERFRRKYVDGHPVIKEGWNVFV